MPHPLARKQHRAIPRPYPQHCPPLRALGVRLSRLKATHPHTNPHSFGEQLLLLSDQQTAVQHYQNVTADGLRRTALEHWYSSRCHHHVITAHSGMGRTAAFASLRPGPSLYSMEVDSGRRLWGRGCGVWDADRPTDTYHTWSGV